MSVKNPVAIKVAVFSGTKGVKNQWFIVAGEPNSSDKSRDSISPVEKAAPFKQTAKDKHSDRATIKNLPNSCEQKHLNLVNIPLVQASSKGVSSLSGGGWDKDRCLLAPFVQFFSKTNYTPYFKPSIFKFIFRNNEAGFPHYGIRPF
jgi:hypothetical protein